MPLPMIPYEALAWTAALFLAPVLLLGLYAAAVATWLSMTAASRAPVEPPQPISPPQHRHEPRRAA